MTARDPDLAEELRREMAELTEREAHYVVLYIKAMKAGRQDLCLYLVRRSRRRAAA